MRYADERLIPFICGLLPKSVLDLRAVYLCILALMCGCRHSWIGVVWNRGGDRSCQVAARSPKVVPQHARRIPANQPMTTMLPVETAVRMIYEQHRRVGQVLAVLGELSTRTAEGATDAELELLNESMRYADEFCALVHHRIEDAFLFPALRGAGAPDDMMMRAALEHRDCAIRVIALRDSLAGRPEGGPRFADAMRNHVARETAHMRFEEQVLLPFAVDCLPASDWVVVAQALQQAPDPLLTSGAATLYARLKDRLDRSIAIPQAKGIP